MQNKKSAAKSSEVLFSFLTQSGIYTFCSRYVTTANPSWQAYAVTSHRPSPTNLITWRVNRLQRLPFGQFTPVHFQLLILLPPFFFLSFFLSNTLKDNGSAQTEKLQSTAGTPSRTLNAGKHLGYIIDSKSGLGD